MPQQEPGTQPLDDGLAPQHPVPRASGTLGVSFPVSEEVDDMSFSPAGFPQLGHSLLSAFTLLISSYTFPHSRHLYSYIGMIKKLFCKNVFRDVGMCTFNDLTAGLGFDFFEESFLVGTVHCDARGNKYFVGNFAHRSVP